MIRQGSAALAIEALPAEDDWRGQAACRGEDPDLFFAVGGASPELIAAKKARTNQAKRICAGCPVRQECLDWALETQEPHGVFGGVDEGDRRRMLRQRGDLAQSGPGRPLAPCGTRKAYDRHKRRGEPIDSACKAARYASAPQDAGEQSGVAA